jgi:iron complex transport system ATP-binding protein
MNSAGILNFDTLKIGYVSGRHQKTLLPPLNASANSGELVAVIGRNGIGKSTLLRTLIGIQPSIDGNIFVGGKNIREYSRIELAQKVGYISTENVKVSNMNVYDLVSLGRFPYTDWIGTIDEENNIIILNALEKTGMLDFRDRLVSELSDGERQRAMIARILAQDTGIMIMDEPTAFLDIGSKYEIMHLLHHLSHAEGKTVIFSTHDLSMAISQADKIWLILENKLIEGGPEDLMITGAFDQLFDPSTMQFNSESGTFSVQSSKSRSIFLEGEGALRQWTKNAINRSGFSVSDLKTETFIKLPSINNKNWQLLSEDLTLEFGTIYELVSWLGNSENQII